MKSVIFLHGGNTSESFIQNKDFWRELGEEALKRKGSNNNEINFLLIPFACESNYNIEYGAIKKRIEKYNPTIDINGGDIASETDSEFFKTQLLHADLIFVSGGNGNKLQETIELLVPIDEFRELVSNDKVIAGVSAGGNLFSRFHWSRMNNAVTEGFNILPVRNFPHYDYNRDFEVKQLENHRSNIELELIKLRDWEYVRREVK